MKAFWIYFTLAILFLFASTGSGESPGWALGIWGITGCQPWTEVLRLFNPNGSFTILNVSVMTALNTVIIFLWCRAKQKTKLLSKVGTKSEKAHDVPV